MGVPEKIAELEAQLAKTQVNKATEHHVALVKAKIARLKAEQEVSAKKGGGGSSGSFDVKKAGNSTVVFIGLPSTGKSTLLNALTGAHSKIASYAFTTLTVVPGMMSYKGAKIQLLDLPGIIAGAREGRGRGKEVLAVARNADLVLLIVDSLDPHYVGKLKGELYGIGIRLDQSPPNVFIHKEANGGLDVHFDRKSKQLSEKLVRDILGEYGIFNGSVAVRQEISADEFIDVVAGNRKYVPSLVVLNKIDLMKKSELAALDIGAPFCAISAEKRVGIEELKEQIFRKLKLMRVYTKSRFEGVDKKEPLMVREGSTIGEACAQIHRELAANFKYALVWGSSAKHPGQRVGLQHVLQDGDVFFVHAK